MGGRCAALLVLVVTLLLIACQTTTQSDRVTSVERVSPTLVDADQPGGGSAGTARPAGVAVPNDPCAMRLHDLEGALLAYYATRGRLPAKIDELHTVPGFEAMELVCPVSKKPYVYSADGVVAAGVNGRVVLCDPEPTHGGSRWAVVISETGSGGALVTKVLLLAETRFE